MYTYVNKLNAAVNQDKTEVVLNFLQEIPNFENPSSGITKVEAKEIAAVNLVMGENLARNLANTILAMLECED